MRRHLHACSPHPVSCFALGVGHLGDWEFEVGQPPQRPAAAGGMLMEANTNVRPAVGAPFALHRRRPVGRRRRTPPPFPSTVPAVVLGVFVAQPIFVRQDQVKSFQWRIRNLPYPVDVYS